MKYTKVKVTVELVMEVGATEQLTPCQNAESIMQRIIEHVEGDMMFGDFGISSYDIDAERMPDAKRSVA